jgi:hypothetical protein
MKSDRIKELQDFSNEFYLRLQETEKTPINDESKNNRSVSQQIKKSYSTLNSDPHIKTTFVHPNKNLSSKKNKSTLKLSAYNALLPWIPPRYVGRYFESFKRLKDEYDLSNWEKHRINLSPRSYQKEKLLPLKKNFICKKLYNYELNKYPNNQFTIDDAVKNLAPYGKNLIRIFINENDKREQKQKIFEEKLYEFKHSKPPVYLNPWKFSNHVIEEFSRPKADEIYGYREKKKVKYAYTVDPFRRPKDQGDLFDKHIGIL